LRSIRGALRGLDDLEVCERVLGRCRRGGYVTQHGRQLGNRWYAPVSLRIGSGRRPSTPADVALSATNPDGAGAAIARSQRFGWYCK
jgi:hypothetical protein